MIALPPRPAGTTTTRWLYDALRAAIVDGRLRAGARLPATRELAARYGVARGTVVSAYEQLKAEGYVEAVVGSGTRVRDVLPDRLLESARPARRGGVTPTRAQSRAVQLSAFARRVRPMLSINTGPARAFRANEPAIDLFPTTLWAQIAGRRLRRASRNLLSGCGPLGYAPLQAAVADYVATTRGVRCVPEQVVIVSGTQAALDLVARLCIDPGDRVAVENPGYIGATRIFEAAGASIVPVPVDAEGMQLGDAALTGARLVYVTPAHQFPLGTSMSVARRLALLEWARTSGALIFEDDYDSEFRYRGRPLPALQGLDRSEHVIFSGSFSKVLFPSLRIGYLVVPEVLIDAFTAALSITHRHAPILDQAVLADFIEAGHFGRHVRRMREVYAQRLFVLLDSARTRLAGALEVSDIEAGLQTVGWLSDDLVRGGLTGSAVSDDAARNGVQVVPISRYAHAPFGREGLQLGFAPVDEKEIRRGVEVLAQAIRTPG